ncbi:DNA-directed RNA polymerase subunit P [Candidatus Woesearchaeota archaeon]|nr:DNA-directed RNA polymerase subunit P [Candidatus Woesearchaeota archaeon]
MVNYTCFQCSKKIGIENMGKRIRCPYCGSKMLYKSRSTITHIKAR